VFDGKLTKENPSNFIPLFNPTTGEEYAHVPITTKEEFNIIIDKMKIAQSSWADTAVTKRSNILFKFKSLIEKDFDGIAKIISEEHGKVFSDAKGSLQRGLEVVDFACGIPHLLKGNHSINVGSNVDSFDIRQPLGICAGITPFNFPAMVPMWMFPLSIACGNAFMLKPSEKVPQCSLRLAELLTEAGLPENVLTLVNGDKSVVDLILQSPDISSVSFVGSTPVAKYIYTECAKYNKRVQALGGAKNHMLIMEDANLEDAVNGLIGAAFGSSVAIPIGKIQKPFMDLLKEKASLIKVGESLDPQSEMGPLITKEHKQKVLSYIDKGIKEGADLEMDGRNISLQGFENGNFVGPTIFNNVKTDMTIYQEEIFGPVTSVFDFNDEEEAINIANSTKYGLASGVFTADDQKAKWTADRIQAGIIWQNDWFVDGVNLPGGGYKRSGYGRDGGVDGIYSHGQTKRISKRLI
jgi:malonate-semialdehyde dehydrogenase (acetylating)/methylmalonate-semialdehyde dehydrogenase